MTAWLLTWLWQGIALTIAVAVVLRWVPGLNAATRHVVWCGALIALVWLGLANSPYWGLTPVSVPGLDSNGTDFAANAVIYVAAAPDFLVTTFSGIWAAIALVRLIRVLPALHGVYSLRNRCRPFPRHVESRLPLWLEANGRGRHAELQVCDAVPGATVLGLERPCIAMPSALIAALTSDELDQVILHEHAHIQRRDDWTRLAESMLLAVLWIHPASLFIARALNREREMACDEWVLARTGHAKAYARCLARAAELRGRMRSGSALAPALLGGGHELIRRVDRLLAIKGTARRNVSVAGVAAVTATMVFMSMHIQSVRFAEISAIVLPHVSGPLMAMYDGATTPFAEMTHTAPQNVRLKANIAAMARLEPSTSAFAPRATADKMVEAATAADARVASTVAPASQIAFALAASGAPDTSVDMRNAPVVSARTFKGAWAAGAPFARNAPDALMAPVARDAPAAPVAGIAPNAPNVWAAPAIEIASAAKKTSIGVANVFSRAGVSLARSF